MSNYLIINTAENTEILLLSGEKRIYRSVEKVMASERLLPLIRQALEEFNLSLNDIDAFGAVTGPGSFTGIRIGVATVRAFAYALKKTAVGVSYFEVLSKNADLPCSVLINSAGNVYCLQHFEHSGAIEPVTVSKDDLQNLHSEIVCDEALSKLFPYCKKSRGDGSDLEKAFLPLLCQNNGAADANSYKKIVPLYMRRSQAEREAGEL